MRLPENTRHALRDDTGLSLSELLIAVALMSIVVTTSYLVLTTGQNIANRTASQVIATDEARVAADRISTEIRQAEELVDSSGNGTGAFATAEPRRCAFFVDIDSDDTIERVTYYVDGTTIKRTVAEPASTPVIRSTTWQSDSAPQTVLRGLSTTWAGAVFTYRGVGSGAPVLTAVSAIPDMSAVELHLVTRGQSGDVVSIADETVWVKIRAVQNTIQ